MIRYLRILRAQRRPVRFLAARLLVKTGLCAKLTIAQAGYQLRFYPSNLAEQLWVDPTWREPELALIRAYLRPGDHVIDVGANIGDTALTASRKVGPEGKVWAIEAHPRTYQFLCGNLSLNGASNVQPLNTAAAGEPGEVTFGDDRRDDMNRVGAPGIVVRASRLDDTVEFRGRVDLLKIDVEGYELQVLEGAPEILAVTRSVLFEVSESHFQNYGYDLHALLGLLVERGFCLLKPLGLSRFEVIDAHYRTDRVENLVAVRDLREFTERSGWSAA